jgi:hypothetical protein
LRENECLSRFRTEDDVVLGNSERSAPDAVRRPEPLTTVEIVLPKTSRVGDAPQPIVMWLLGKFRFEVLESAVNRSNEKIAVPPIPIERWVGPQVSLAHGAVDGRESNKLIPRRPAVAKSVRGEEDDQVAGTKVVPHILSTDTPGHPVSKALAGTERWVVAVVERPFVVG